MPEFSELSIVFFGMRCAFSQPPLRALIAAGVDLRAVIVPGPLVGPPVMRQKPQIRLPLAGATSSLDDLAHQAGVPLIAVRDLHQSEVHTLMHELAPAVIVVACFPWLLPRQLRDEAALASINIHPSLLPIGRGPEPIFWTFRRGETQTGITIHRLSGRFDAGTIFRQETIPVPEGIRLPDLELQLAELGGKLVVQVLTDFLNKSASVDNYEQDDHLATSAPFPADEDFVVATDRSARWAYNFVRGVAPLNRSLMLHVVELDQWWSIRDALDWQPMNVLGQPVVVSQDEIVAQFPFGTTRFRRP